MFRFLTSKRQILTQTASFGVFCVRVRGGIMPVGERKTPKTSQVNNSVCEVAYTRKRNSVFDLDKKTLQDGTLLDHSYHCHLDC